MASPSPLAPAVPTAVQTVAAVRAGTTTARAAVQASLDRISAVDGTLGAFQVVRTERALAEADELDRRSDLAALPLGGLPVAVKDNVSVSGEPMRDGSAGSDPAPQAEDHAVVQRLRAAGAVVVGITRVPELCVVGATDSVFGTTRNPWELGRTPGGSSGGSAAAVAAGAVAVAHGNDGMGSIRIPAACCGLVGIKPGLGTVPAGLGAGSWYDMAENGPLGTTVADVALVLSVLAARPDLADVAAAPGRLRVALSVKSPAVGSTVDRAYADAARRTADSLAGAGHRVQESDPPYSTGMMLAATARWVAGTARDAEGLADPSAVERRVARHAALGRAVIRRGGPTEAGRARWQRDAERFFADHDVLLTPALAQRPLPAVRWGTRGWLPNVLSNSRYAPFAAPWNLAGWPAMTVPAGRHPAGTPLAVQLVARPGGEALLLSLAAQLEALQPWTRLAPDPVGR
ncbi:MAG TPA: amidase family protein [Mycobacteriales bacterium]|nr:amidase family protein [Mycobacteriales bacterium]